MEINHDMRHLDRIMDVLAILVVFGIFLIGFAALIASMVASFIN